MQQYRGLEVTGALERIRGLESLIRTALPDGWAYCDRVPTSMITGYSYVYSVRTPTGSRAATLTLTETKGAEGLSKLVVAGIKPDCGNELGRPEYNSVIDVLLDIVEPHLSDLDLVLQCDHEGPELKHYMTLDCAKKLRVFSQSAAKTAGAAHPLDKNRWCEFIVSAYLEGASLESTFLARWLVESEGWPAKQAWILASEYELSRRILETYERKTN